MNDIDKAKEILKEYNQEHIINLFNKIEENQQQQLAKQVLKIDFNKITELYENTKKEIDIKEKTITPIEYLDKEKLSKDEKEKLDELGIEILKQAQYAVVTMAGRSRY